MANHQSSTTVLWSWEYRDDDRPRPAEVRRLEALLNTVDHHHFGRHAEKPPEFRDRLATAAQTRQWLAEHDVIDPDESIGEADAHLVRDFRDGLRAHIEHRDGDRAAAPETWPPPMLRLRAQTAPDGDAVQLVSASEGIHGVLERLVADAVIAEARGTLLRLKVCAAADCRFAYYDHSRSRTSRWCSMRTCGNRSKTRQYRRRHR